MELEVEITSRDGSIADGHIVLEERPLNDRTKQAAKSFVIFGFAAFLSAFIPIIHFFAVPILVIAAFFMAANAYFDTHRILSGEAICARCKHVTHIESRPEIYPLIYDCEKCQSRMTGYRRSTQTES